MNLPLYISGFLLGFLGSFHCAGMCGPLVFMLPKNSESPGAIFAGRFIYNSGRVVTYIAIGLLFGLFGMALALKGFQRELSVLTGVLIVVTVLFTAGKKERVKAYSVSAAYTNPIRNTLKKLFSTKTYFSLFLIGILNGLLPCGFVYLAVAGATSTGSVGGGMLYMALFGLGTFPVMMTLSLAANFLGIKFRKIFTKISPLIAIALAVFLIYRGTDMKMEDCSTPHRVSQINCEVPK